MTRGDVLAHSIAFALIRARKVVRGLEQPLTEAERMAVARATIAELTRHRDIWGLDQEVDPPVTGSHSASVPIDR